MSKFKVGDLVKRIADPAFDYRYMISGEVYTVSGLPEDDYDSIEVNNLTERWDYTRFELYRPEQPTVDLQSELEEALAKIESLESALEDAVRELISLREGKNTAVIDVNQEEDKPYDVIQFKPVEHYTLEDWKEAMWYDWKFKTRSGNVVLIEGIDNEDDNRPICDSNGYYHNINGMWDESVGEDIDDIIKRVK